VAKCDRYASRRRGPLCADRSRTNPTCGRPPAARCRTDHREATVNTEVARRCALERLIAGYDCLDERSRRIARVSHAGQLHDELHAYFLARAAAESIPVAPEEDALLVKPWWWIPSMRRWNGTMPLVLLDIHYAPFGFRGCPVAGEGVIVWLRPTTEDAYLYSIADLWAMLDLERIGPGCLRDAMHIALEWLREVRCLAA